MVNRGLRVWIKIRRGLLAIKGHNQSAEWSWNKLWDPALHTKEVVFFKKVKICIKLLSVHL